MKTGGGGTLKDSKILKRTALKTWGGGGEEEWERKRNGSYSVAFILAAPEKKLRETHEVPTFRNVLPLFCLNFYSTK